MTDPERIGKLVEKKTILNYAIIAWISGISIFILLGNWDDIPVNNFNKIFVLSIYLISFAISPIVAIAQTIVMNHNDTISTSKRLQNVGRANGVGFFTFAIILILFVPFTITSMNVEGNMNVNLSFVLFWFLFIFVATVISGTVTQYMRLRLEISPE